MAGKNSTTCSVPDCNLHAAAKGMCWKHYGNNRRHGNPISRVDWTLDQTLEAIGWNITETGCWEWQGNLAPNGYGLLTLTRQGIRNKGAHRIMYERHVGPIPEDQVIRHKCDNPPCVNPDHLETGTREDNMRDMVSRGRHRYGPNRPNLSR